MKINFIVPSYRRGQSLQRLVRTVIGNADNPENVYWTFVLHVGDQGSIDTVLNTPNSTIVFERHETPHLAEFMNLGYFNSSPSDVYVYIGDDFECVTKHWDRKVLDDLDNTNGWSIVCGPDGYLGMPSCPTYFFISRRLVDAVGEFVCPQFHREGTDKAWGDNLGPLGLVTWLPTLRFTHHHATRAGGNMDETYKRLCNTPNPSYGSEYKEYVKAAQLRIQEAMKAS